MTAPIILYTNHFVMGRFGLCPPPQSLGLNVYSRSFFFLKKISQTYTLSISPTEILLSKTTSWKTYMCIFSWLKRN
jgi:hypothetical protein